MVEFGHVSNKKCNFFYIRNLVLLLMFFTLVSKQNSKKWGMCEVVSLVKGWGYDETTLKTERY
jgi:lipoprotein signal peptidase